MIRGPAGLLPNQISNAAVQPTPDKAVHAAGSGGLAVKAFFSNRSGNYGMMMAVLTLPLLLSVGMAVDYSRYLAAQEHLQGLADAASLALAASDEEDEDKLKQLARRIITSNESESRIDEVKVSSISLDDDSVDIKLSGGIHTYFLGLANIQQLEVKASSLAVRAVTGSVEVALVLDNTWSMSEKDSKGNSKIGTLKTAAKSLVNELMSNKEAVVRIGLVPYADYVNVGTKYRNASWLDIPDDYSVEPKERTCETKTTKSVCTAHAAKYSCTKTIDGVEEPATCGGGCTNWETQTVPPYESCSGGGNPTYYKWYGCVGSRKVGTTRLNDGSPSVRYPGYVETKQKCLNPIVPLTDKKSELTNAIDDMIINIGGYKPYTYIPAGLIWGQNVLSHSDPFDQGAAYDPKNVEPRKVIVLMTDGDNTLRFRSSDGRHVSLNNDPAKAADQVAVTNDDTAAICDYAKSNMIEIFTVAFMVDNAAAKDLLQGCATDAQHYYDASDSEKLVDAFSGIARSLSQVRLAR